MNISFPVFVCTKDSGEIEIYESVYELQCHLERIDVENAEFLVWDKNGTPVSMGLQKPVWLNLKSSNDLQQPDLRGCLEKYAYAQGLSLKIIEKSADEFRQAWEKANAKAKLRDYPNPFRWFMKRK